MELRNFMWKLFCLVKPSIKTFGVLPWQICIPCSITNPSGLLMLVGYGGFRFTQALVYFCRKWPESDCLLRHSSIIEMWMYPWAARFARRRRLWSMFFSCVDGHPRFEGLLVLTHFLCMLLIMWIIFLITPSWHWPSLWYLYCLYSISYLVNQECLCLQLFNLFIRSSCGESSHSGCWISVVDHDFGDPRLLPCSSSVYPDFHVLEAPTFEICHSQIW